MLKFSYSCMGGCVRAELSDGSLFMLRALRPDPGRRDSSDETRSELLFFLADPVKLSALISKSY